MINSKIKIEPRVIQHLGQDLITSPEVAVTELLKTRLTPVQRKSIFTFLIPLMHA